MTQLTYDYGVMSQAIADIQSATNSLTQTHADINADMNRLGQTWTEGSDHARYVAYQQAWEKVFEDVNLSLAGLRQVAEGCLSNAKENETKNASMWPDA
ncbi:MAG: WXG100 family type VII secretion target [Pseudonocardiales bacterium]